MAKVETKMEAAETAKPIEREVTITLTLKEAAEALGYLSGRDAWKIEGDYLDADPYEDVWHTGYSESDALNFDDPKGMDGAAQLFPAQIAIAAETAGRYELAAEITKERHRVIEQAFDKIEPVGEYLSADNEMISVGGTGISCSVDASKDEVALKIKNPEHLINDIVAGVGRFAPEMDPHVAASDEEIKAGIIAHAGDYFEVYGDRKPAVSDRIDAGMDEDVYAEEAKHQIGEMTPAEIAEAVIDAVDAGRFESENEAIALAAKLTNEPKADIAKAVKAALSGKKEKLSSRESDVTEESVQMEAEEVMLHSTLQPDHYYVEFSKLPKEAQEKLKAAEVEVENSRYTVGEDMAFIRAEVEVNGKLWDAEISLGSVDIRHAGYEWDDEEGAYVDEDGRPIDSDEHAEYMASELAGMSELDHMDVYLNLIEELKESGEKFKKLTRQLAAKGARDPKALAAWIGREKLGKEEFQKKAAAGRKAKSEAISEGKLDSYELYDIEYDTDGEEVSLPKSLKVELPKGVDPYEDGADLISDQTGWLVKSFKVKKLGKAISEGKLEDQAEKLIAGFEKKIGIEKAISDKVSEKEIDGVEWRYGGREVSASTPEGKLFIWDVNSIGDRHSYMLFDIQDENGESISEAKVKVESVESGDLEDMVDQYLITMLWAETDQTDPNTGGDPLDKNFDISDVTDESVREAEKDCQDFYAQAKAALEKEGFDIEELEKSDLGHDFWLTRNGHGAGFWDGDYEKRVGEILTQISKKFGPKHPYITGDVEDPETKVAVESTDLAVTVNGKSYGYVLNESKEMVQEATWLPRTLKPEHQELVSEVSNKLGYEVDAAMAFSVALLEDVNAHEEAAKVNAALTEVEEQIKLGEDKKVIGRWESKSGKHWVELHQFDDGGFGYRAPDAGGVMGAKNLDDAMAEIQKKIDAGYFQPDSAKTPMKKVEVPATSGSRELKEAAGDGPAVYVGTYGKYNSGSIKGKWLNLEDYASHDDFMEAAKELHKDEEDPELMFQDYQGFPEKYYSESSIDPKLWDWLELDEEDRELLEVYIDEVNDEDATIDQARDAFRGKYDSERDWAIEDIDQNGGLSESQAANFLYVDDVTARQIGLEEADIRIGDMDEEEIVSEAGMDDEYNAAVRAKEIEDEIDDLDDEEDAAEIAKLEAELAQIPQGARDPDAILSKARDEVDSKISDEIEEKIKKDAVGYFVDELGAYTIEELAKQSFVSIDYDAYARDARVRGDISFVRKDGSVWVFANL